MTLVILALNTIRADFSSYIHVYMYRRFFIGALHDLLVLKIE